MAAIHLTIEVPSTSSYDVELLKQQLTGIARALLHTTATGGKRSSVHAQESDDNPFACFSGDWGGADKTAHQLADEIRASRYYARDKISW